MAEKGFGVKEVNLIGASGTPTITSPNNLNLNAVNVAISTNATIGGNLTVTGTVGIAGTLTYEDVTNIDAIGIVTARTGLKVLAGGANVVGVVTATSFTGSGANLTSLPAGNLTGTLPAISGANLTNLPADTPTNSDIQVVYTVTANGSSAYRFGGNGIVSTEDNPDVYLMRGFKYRFVNNSGGSHPFQIRQSSGGSAYSAGVTNNGASSGNIDFQVPYSAPSRLYYQCTSHGGMVGNFYIRGAGGQNTNVGVTTFSGAVSMNGQVGIGTEFPATYKLHLKGTTSALARFERAGAAFAKVDIKSGTNSGNSYLTFSDSDASEVAAINYEHADDTLRIETWDGDSKEERLRIASDGNVTLGDASFGSSLGQLRIINNASSAPASLALFGHNNTNDGDAFAQIQFAEQESGTGGQIKAKIEAQAVSTNERGADLVLFTAANSSSSTATERLRIDSDGTITTPHQFHIEVQRTNDQTGYVANANFGTPMIFNDVVRTRGTTNSALNTSTGKITVPVDGVYYLEASVFTSTGDYLSQAWFTEGNSRMQYSDWTEHQSTNQVQVSGMHYLSANTEVGFHPYGSSSTSLTLNDSLYHTWFRVTLIG